MTTDFPLESLKVRRRCILLRCHMQRTINYKYPSAMCKEGGRNVGILSPKCYVFIKLLLLKLRGMDVEEEAERFKSQRWCTTPRKQSLPGTAGLMQV